MTFVNNAKSMAKALETTLRAKNVDISHGECLDIVARQFGLKDWNVLSAQAKSIDASASRRAKELKVWEFRAAYPDVYDHGADEQARVPHGSSALIRLIPEFAASRYPDISKATAGYMQTASARPYRGKRVAVSARLRSEGVSHGATILASVGGAPGRVFAYDNLKDHPDGWLLGNTPWTERRVVIDVDADAESLFFGFLLNGSGAVWAADFSAKEVKTSVPLTGERIERRAIEPVWRAPANLQFVEVADLLRSAG
ncbi:glyoxalase superfamily protein [Methylobacterium fujisawaense]